MGAEFFHRGDTPGPDGGSPQWLAPPASPLSPPPQRFASLVEDGIRAALGPQLDRALALEDARRAAMRHFPGQIFRSQSFKVYVVRDWNEFHANVPADLAVPEVVGAIKAAVVEAERATGLRLQVTKDVRGGSNYVLEGKLSAA